MRVYAHTHTHKHTQAVTRLSSAADVLVILMRSRRLKGCVVLGVTLHVELYQGDQRSRRGTRMKEVENVS